MSFPCLKCGACCHGVNAFPALASLALPDGICRNLAWNNICLVYNNRPLACRVEALRKACNADEHGWYAKQAEYCREVHLRNYGTQLQELALWPHG